MGKLERDFQPKLIEEIKTRLPGCHIHKMDANYIQGVPDLLILHRDKWALLEAKKAENAVHQPNQDHYVDQFNEWSFSAFVYPENKDQVLDDLEQALSPRRQSRATKRK